MKVNGNTAPSAAFTVEKIGDVALVRFYQNVEEVVTEDNTTWTWDEYRLKRAYYEGLAADIEANYSTWLTAAKAEEEQKNPPDANQMRADLDYALIMIGVLSAQVGGNV